MTQAAGILPRQLAYKVLLPFEKAWERVGLGTALRDQKPVKPSGLKVEEGLHQALSLKSLPAADGKLVTTLVYGVLRDWHLLEALLKEMSHFPWEKVSPQVRLLGKLGGYQLMSLDGVPDYAAVDSVMNLAHQLKLSQKSIGFLNGLLRAFQRQRQLETQEASQPAWQSSPSRWILPAHLRELLAPEFSEDTLNTMALALRQPPTLTLRVNTLKTTLFAYELVLKEAKIQATSVGFDCLRLEGFYGGPTQLPGYAEGWFVVQDVHAAEVSHWVAPKPGEIIVDLCAAPGGKTTHLAALMQNQGQLIAVESEENRIQRLNENIARLGVAHVNVTHALGQDSGIPSGTVDRVLVDVPCSGTGTLRQHPEIMLQFNPRQLAELNRAQRDLLEAAWLLLKPGGILVYSTCSLLPAENQMVINSWLTDHPEASEALVKAQSYPISTEGDGFYMAYLQKPA